MEDQRKFGCTYKRLVPDKRGSSHRHGTLPFRPLGRTNSLLHHGTLASPSPVPKTPLPIVACWQTHSLRCSLVCRLFDHARGLQVLRVYQRGKQGEKERERERERERSLLRRCTVAAHIDHHGAGRSCHCAEIALACRAAPIQQPSTLPPSSSAQQPHAPTHQSPGLHFGARACRRSTAGACCVGRGAQC